MIRKYIKRQQQEETSIQINNSIPTRSNCVQQQNEEHSKIKQDDNHGARNSKHIYSIPRWSSDIDFNMPCNEAHWSGDNDFNMSYNEAYDSAFSITVNAAYSSVKLQH